LENLGVYINGDLLTFAVSSVAIVLSYACWRLYYITSKSDLIERLPSWALAVALLIIAAGGVVLRISYEWFYVPLLSGSACLLMISPLDVDAENVEESVRPNRDMLVKSALAAVPMLLIIAVIEKSILVTAGLTSVGGLLVYLTDFWDQLLIETSKKLTAVTEDRGHAVGIIRIASKELVDERQNFDRMEAKFVGQKRQWIAEYGAFEKQIAQLEKDLASQKGSNAREHARFSAEAEAKDRDLAAMNGKLRRIEKASAIKVARLQIRAASPATQARLRQRVLNAIRVHDGYSLEKAVLVPELARGLHETVEDVWVTLEEMSYQRYIGIVEGSRNLAEWTELVYLTKKGLKEAVPGKSGKDKQYIQNQQIFEASVGQAVQGTVTGGTSIGSISGSLRQVNFQGDPDVREAVLQLLVAAEEPEIAEILEEEYPEVGTALDAISGAVDTPTLRQGVVSLLERAAAIGVMAKPLLDCAEKIHELLTR
jgi:hypothetical protein